MSHKPKPVILCVDDEREITESLRTELGEILGDSCVVELAESGEEAIELCRELIHDGREIPVVICDYIMPKMKGDELLAEVHLISPATKTILLTGQATAEGVTNAVNSADLYRYIAKPWEPEDLAITLREAIKSFRQELDLDQRIRELESEREKVTKERKVIDTLSKILNEKISELEIQKRELEQISRELNITTIEKILIEQEAEQMSRTLTALQNSLTNNLFIRSVLHSLVNMLQIQLSVDRRENTIIDDLAEEIHRLAIAVEHGNTGRREILAFLENIRNLATNRLTQQRRKTELNIHKTMTGYIKAVQRSLMGETIYFNTRPTHLMSMVNRVKQKYREILEDASGGINIAFDTVLHAPDVYIGVLDFALINILENLLTNSIRKVHESKKKRQWIRLETSEQTIDNEEYTVCRWEDNGTGVVPSRKQSIFDGDSDKTEEGDHGIGLRDIRNTVESSGGFIREEGIAGEGAVFIIGFPKVSKVEEINYDEDLEEETLAFPAVYRQKKIFVVDDDTQILSLFRGFLQKAGIRDVTVFTRADDALAAIKTSSPGPDLVVTDLEMEPVNGLAFVKNLKDSGKSVPVLVVSGILFHGTPTDYSLLKELNMLGVRDIVRKPVDFIELFNKMQRILA